MAPDAAAREELKKERTPRLDGVVSILLMDRIGDASSYEIWVDKGCTGDFVYGNSTSNTAF